MKKFISLCLSMLLILLLNPIASFSKEAVCVYRPKVSVVIPVYKVEPWLRECMDSLVNQTLKDIEIICVDDGSPDSCGAILDEYARKDNRVKAIHQRNQGVQKARNAGLDIARGEYIALVDSDDYVDLRTYETAYNLAKKDRLHPTWGSYLRSELTIFWALFQDFNREKWDCSEKLSAQLE